MPTRKARKGARLPKSNNARTRRRRARNRAKSANNLLSRNAMVRGLTPVLSMCSDNYARVLTTPFTGVREGSACIPDSITLPSAKFKTSCRGIFHTGTQGAGFVAADPFCGVQNGGRVAGTTSSGVITFSQTGYTSAGYRDPGTAFTTFAPSNSQYNQTFFTDPLANPQFRLVGSGLRCRYIGAELTRQGRMVPYKTRSNTNLQDGTVIADLLADNYYHTIPIDKNWHQITYTPSRTSDISYLNWDDPTISNNPFRCMMILVDGTNPNSPFEFEWVGYYEMVANEINLPTTSSHSDPSGFGAVLSALPTSLISTASTAYTYVKQGALKILGTAMSGLVSRAASAIGGSLMGPVGAYAAGAGSRMLLTSGPSIEEIE